MNTQTLFWFDVVMSGVIFMSFAKLLQTRAPLMPISVIMFFMLVVPLLIIIEVLMLPFSIAGRIRMMWRATRFIAISRAAEKITEEVEKRLNESR